LEKKLSPVYGERERLVRVRPRRSWRNGERSVLLLWGRRVSGCVGKKVSNRGGLLFGLFGYGWEREGLKNGGR
jgi:hypothetical protein